MSKAIQKVMLDYVIPNLDQDEIEELKVELAKLSSPADPPKPHAWRQWDLAVYVEVFYIRVDFSKTPWHPIFPSQRNAIGQYLSDEGMKDAMLLGNLADLFAQGDVLVALTEEDRCDYFAHTSRYGYHPDVQNLVNKIRAQLAARKETL